MTPEKLAKVIAATRRKADAGHEQSTAVVEGLCKEAERLVERVVELEGIISQGSAEFCMKKRVDGVGCGACASCCRELRRQLDHLESDLHASREELHTNQLRARSAEGIAGLSLPEVIQALKDSG